MTPEASLEPAADVVARSLISSLQERRQLVEHREEVDHLLATDRKGALGDALALALYANRRNTYQTDDS